MVCSVCRIIMHPFCCHCGITVKHVLFYCLCGLLVFFKKKKKGSKRFFSSFSHHGEEIFLLPAYNRHIDGLCTYTEICPRFRKILNMAVSLCRLIKYSTLAGLFLIYWYILDFHLVYSSSIRTLAVTDNDKLNIIRLACHASPCSVFAVISHVMQWLLPHSHSNRTWALGNYV